MRLHAVDVGPRDIAAYRAVCGDDTIDALIDAAANLRGLRVLHLNATPYGGGVSELLRSTIPLLRSLGIDAQWKLISGDAEFFSVTKTIHDALQGGPQGLSPAQCDAYLRTSQRNAKAMLGGWDIVVAHDPQPAALRVLRPDSGAAWVWRCHIDMSDPNRQVWEFLRPYLAPYDAAILTMQEFVPDDMPIDEIRIVPPAIDPLSPKNLRLPDPTARQVLSWIGIDLGQPLITQVARFDPWKDPFGVIEAYRRVRDEIPNLQLALVGSMAMDDPPAWELHRRLQEISLADPLLHVFTNLNGVGNIEVNAFQRMSDVVVQKSLREGFGLVVSEAMWKGTPVVAGRAGGIPMQVGDDEGGILVDGIDSTADALLRLLQDPELADRLGRRGRQRVRDRYLLPRLLGDEIALMRDLTAIGAAAVASLD